VPPELLRLQKNVQFPDEPVRIKGAQIHYVTSSLWAIGVRKKNKVLFSFLFFWSALTDNLRAFLWEGTMRQYQSYNIPFSPRRTKA
jgi:hypothetical protein